MSRYVRQIAWLHAPIEEQHKSINDGEIRTRFRQMKAAKIKPSLPDNPAPYLTGWLFDIGPSMAAGPGEAPLSLAYVQQELSVLGVDVLPWEAKLLRRLSIDYIDQRQKARKPSCPAPYTARDHLAANQDAVANQFKALLSAMREPAGQAR